MNILQLILGRKCFFCGSTADPRDHGICPHCLEEISRQGLVFDGRFSASVGALFYYEGVVRRGLHRFKYRGHREFGNFCGDNLAALFLTRGDCAHLVTCVPRAKDEMPRLYNQSEVIARRFAAALSLPFDGSLLSKREGMKSQPQCHSPRERDENARRAFRRGSSKRDLRGLTVVLIDDLHTTGATVNACSNILKRAGATEVLVYTAVVVSRHRGLQLRHNPRHKIIREEFVCPIAPRRYRIKNLPTGGLPSVRSRRRTDASLIS